MAVVERYWEGVLRRLQAEVDILSGLVRHPGEKGRENELALVRVLASLVPRRYGVGTGLLVDSGDRFGSQTDIVIFDQGNEPSVFAQTTQLLFPVENVRACVEVKTTLDSDDFNDFAKKKKNLLQLVPAGDARRPCFVLFAYTCAVRPETVAKKVQGLPVEERPDVLCVVSPGLIGWPEEEPSADYVVGLTGLHDRDESGLRSAGLFVHPEEDTGDYVLYEGSSYPLVTYDGQVYLGEPARALLLFCEALLVRLAALDGQPVPALHHYLSSEARELLPLPKS